MFRIRLASGKEAVFHSVDELAEGIHSGIVSSTAEIYHGKTQQWLPIAVHPLYEQATGRTSTLVVEADPEEFAPTKMKSAPSGAVQIYSMISKSALELAERRRPRWIAPTVGAVGGLVILAGLTWMVAPTGNSLPDLSQPLTAREMSGAITSSPFSTQSLRSWDNAPSKLSIRLARSVDSSVSQLATRAQLLGLGSVLDPARLGSPEMVLRTRNALFTFEAVLSGHRKAERDMIAAYVDSATMLGRTGAWSRTDLEEWGRRVIQSESPADAARSDSLLVTLDRLYELLLDQEGAYQITNNGVRFTSLAAGDQYDDIRFALRRLSAARRARVDNSGPGLALLLALVGDGDLPPHLNS
jgi:hypothetical protein